MPENELKPLRVLMVEDSADPLVTFSSWNKRESDMNLINYINM